MFRVTVTAALFFVAIIGSAQAQIAAGANAVAAAAAANTVPVAAPPALPLASQTLVTVSDGTMVPVFGSDLFSGAFASARPGPRADYQIQPGDQISVRVYGAVTSDAVQTVDNSGQLFIQGIGPIRVGGIPAGQLQTRVTAALRAVYTNAVGVYVSVVSGGSLGVFVTGDVQRPGRYIGSPSDSVLYFLDQASGIDPLRGSFRNITVRRDGQVVAHYDLYDFIVNGAISPLQFQDGDIVFVGRRGAIVAATGAVRNASAFEAPAGAKTLTGHELAELAVPSGTATSVTVSQAAAGLSNASYLNLQQFGPAALSDGASAIFRAELYTETISVSISGEVKGPKAFVLPRGATLSQVLSQLNFDGSDVVQEYIHIQRNSVASSQKDALNRALDTLQRAVVTEPTYGTDTASAKSSDISAIQQYIAQARQIQPDGNVTIYTDGHLNDLKLESGDTIILPSRTDVVLVAGEVLSPGAFSHNRDFTARDYIGHAGGFGENAQKGKVVLRRADGSALVADAGVHPRAGDQITVVPNFGAGRGIGFFRDMTQIVFQLATTAAVAINLSK